MFLHRGPPLYSCSHRVHPYRIVWDSEWRRGWVGSQSAQSLCFYSPCINIYSSVLFYLVLKKKNKNKKKQKRSPTWTSRHIYTPIHVGALRTHPRGCETVCVKALRIPQANLGSAGPHSISLPGSHEADMPRRKQQAPRRAAGMFQLLLTPNWPLSLSFCSYPLYAPPPPFLSHISLSFISFIY